MTAVVPSILFVEDEAPFRRFAGSFLEENGFKVTYAGDAVEALSLFDQCNPHLVLLDLNLPDLHGLEVLRRLRTRRPHLPVVVLTAYGDAANAVSALKAGATDYLTKPVELDALVRAARAALNASSVIGAREAAKGSDRLAIVRDESHDQLVGEHPAWRRVLERLDRIVASDFLSLLLLGESGTGKTALARRFHERGPGRTGELVQVNCPSIPQALLESELFGHEPGAISGSRERKPGQVERAAGGTLFLDEIGELPPALQPKLLRLLEHGTFRRIGGMESIRADVRIVCSSSRDLRQAVESGALSQDLYYRLEVAAIPLPPLRDRGDDVLLLASDFLREFAALAGTSKAPPFSPEVRRALADHPFPGNVRELRNVVQRSVAFLGPRLSELTEIGLDDLDLGTPVGIQPAPGEGGATLLQPADLEAVINAIEAQYVERALARSASQREAGALLGLDRFALARRRTRVARSGGTQAARLTVSSAPLWLRQLLGEHPRDIPAEGVNLLELCVDLEMRAISRALRATAGNRARAATLLGMSRTSLSRRLEGGE